MGGRGGRLTLTSPGGPHQNESPKVSRPDEP